MQSRKIESAAVLGAGAVGGLLAALLQRGGIKTTCIVRDDKVESLRQSGIVISSKKFGEFTAHPDVAANLQFSPDLLFVTPKFYDLEEALDKISSEYLENTTVVPLLNGLEHMAILRSRFPTAKIAAASIWVEAYRETPNQIRHNSHRVKISIASDDPALRTDLQTAAMALIEFGMEIEIGPSEGFVLWRKIVQLNALALMTTSTGLPFGKIRDDTRLYDQLHSCVREAIAVAKAEGVTIDEQEVFEALAKYQDDFQTSMSRDAQKGNRTELDAIAGAILRRAKEHNLSCPTVERVYSLILSGNQYKVIS